jgi:hypothetical protein
LAAASADGTVRVWDRQGRELRRWKGGRAEFRAVAYSPNGELLAAAGDDENQAIAVWDSQSGQRVATLAGHEHRVTQLLFLTESNRLLSADRNGRIRLWSIEARRTLLEYERHIGDVEGLALLPGGEKFVSAGFYDGLWVRHVAKAESQGRIGEVGSPPAKTLRKEWLHSLAVSPDGKLLATAGEDHAIRLIDLASGKQTGVLTGHSNSINALAVSPDGKLLASGGEDWSARIWNVETHGNSCTKCSAKRGWSTRATRWPSIRWRSPPTARNWPSARTKSPCAFGAWRRARNCSRRLGIRAW